MKNLQLLYQLVHRMTPDEHLYLEKLLREVQLSAIHNENIFAQLMEAGKYCSLGQITTALFEVGGQYRRNM